MSFEKEVWDKFKSIDVKPMMDKNNAGIQYISWSKLWALLMTHYPRSHYEFEDKHYTVVTEDGPTNNVEVLCRLTVVENVTKPRSITREMWLPVMQSYGQFLAIPNPSPRDISDTRMRCLVKAAAMFGLGISAWSGDDYQADQTVERIMYFVKKKGPNGESPSEYRAVFFQLAEMVRNAYDHRDLPEFDELLDEAIHAYKELSEEEKGDFYTAESKGGFMRNELKKWFREVGYRKSQESAA